MTIITYPLDTDIDDTKFLKEHFPNYFRTDDMLNFGDQVVEYQQLLNLDTSKYIKNIKHNAQLYTKFYEKSQTQEERITNTQPFARNIYLNYILLKKKQTEVDADVMSKLDKKVYEINEKQLRLLKKNVNNSSRKTKSQTAKKMNATKKNYKKLPTLYEDKHTLLILQKKIKHENNKNVNNKPNQHLPYSNKQRQTQNPIIKSNKTQSQKPVIKSNKTQSQKPVIKPNILTEKQKRILDENFNYYRDLKNYNEYIKKVVKQNNKIESNYTPAFSTDIDPDKEIDNEPSIELNFPEKPNTSRKSSSKKSQNKSDIN